VGGLVMGVNRSLEGRVVSTRTHPLPGPPGKEINPYNFNKHEDYKIIVVDNEICASS
jgi:hypothetical protein